MSRRQFIGTSVISAVAAASIPALNGHARESTPGQKEGETLESLRVITPLNRNWRFKRQAAPGSAVEAEFVGAEKPQYDDSSWAIVWLPHTWDITPDNPFSTRGHFRGIGWYRTTIDVPESWRGRRVWINFKAVFQVADVWLNGHHAGQHVGGYTGFSLDITDFVTWGSSTLVVLKVDDVLDPFIAPANETNVATYGGIYRTVSLIALNPLHVRENGTWVTTERNSKGVIIRVRTWVWNQSQLAQTAKLENLMVDADGQTQARLESEATIEPGEERFFDQKTDPIASCHLWSPDSPYLYHLVSTVRLGGRPVDRCLTHFGVRFMDHDPARGFLLNGEPINLHGVDRRQDYGFLGDAVPEAIGVKDVHLMKEMGVNFIRTAHYPQDPAVIDACDQLGILVWEEIPNIKLYVYPATSEGATYVSATRFSRPLMSNLKHQLREMIERDRNHSSIIIWGLADDLSEYPYPEDFVELSDATHALDPTRWTAGRAPHVTDVMDATAYPDLITEHEQHPERLYIWNEWGSFHCERGREGSAFFNGRDHSHLAALADSEAALHCEGYLMQWNALPWLGTAFWCMFDCSEPGGGAARSLWEHLDGTLTLRWQVTDYYGAADMWRLPKNSYFLFQSEWTEKPMVHIVSHWTWPGHEGSSRQVRVYSNCDTVEIFLNGRSLGPRKPAAQERIWKDFRLAVDKYRNRGEAFETDRFNQDRLPGSFLRHPPFVWDDVRYEPGSLVAVGRKGSVIVRDERRTAGKAEKLALKADKPTLKADEQDVAFIEADVVDAAGTVVPTARPWISFTAEGPGRLLGGTTEVDAISGVAVINLQSSGDPGEVIISATSVGLSSGTIRLRAAP
jgi:beta-galactosidase